VALETHDAIGREELAELLRASYELVVAKLPKRLRRPQEIKARKTADKRALKNRNRVKKAKKRR